MDNRLSEAELHCVIAEQEELIGQLQSMVTMLVLKYARGKAVLTQAEMGLSGDSHGACTVDSATGDWVITARRTDVGRRGS